MNTYIEKGNRLIQEWMGLPIEAQYRSTGKTDKRGNNIIEGAIINADGYDSNLIGDEPYLHCVVWDDDEETFGSDIYGDFEPLSRYKTIEVVGHVEDWREKWVLEQVSGNVGWGLKDPTIINYSNDWNKIMDAVERIEGKGRAFFTFRNDITIKENGTISSNSIVKYEGGWDPAKRKEAYWETIIKYIEWEIENSFYKKLEK